MNEVMTEVEMYRICNTCNAQCCSRAFPSNLAEDHRDDTIIPGCLHYRGDNNRCHFLVVEDQELYNSYIEACLEVGPIGYAEFMADN